MATYAAWRQLEAEFRALAPECSELQAIWIEIDKPQWWLRGDGAHRFRSLAGIAASAANYQGRKYACEYWLDLVKGYLLACSSKMIAQGTVTSAGNWKRKSSGEIVDGIIFTIYAPCAASADYCLERARQTRIRKRPRTSAPRAKRAAKPSAKPQGPATRERRLQAFIARRSTSVAAVRRAANVAKTNMQEWRKGALSDASVMSIRIEDVLSGKTPLA